MAKIAKSIRVDQEIFAYIERYKGEGFNEKFENIIRDAMESEKKRLEHIKQLDKQIREQEQKLQKIMNEVRKVSDISYQVNNIMRCFTDIEKKLAG